MVQRVLSMYKYGNVQVRERESVCVCWEEGGRGVWGWGAEGRQSGKERVMEKFSFYALSAREKERGDLRRQ